MLSAIFVIPRIKECMQKSAVNFSLYTIIFCILFSHTDNAGGGKINFVMCM